MIQLTNAQRDKLRVAASNIRSEDRAKLTLAETDVIAKRIDAVLVELHEENPFAFSTRVVYTDEGIKFLRQNEVKKLKYGRL